jgi:hypothetical protein
MVKCTIFSVYCKLKNKGGVRTNDKEVLCIVSENFNGLIFNVSSQNILYVGHKIFVL